MSSVKAPQNSSVKAETAPVQTNSFSTSATRGGDKKTHKKVTLSAKGKADEIESESKTDRINEIHQELSKIEAEIKDLEKLIESCLAARKVIEKLTHISATNPDQDIQHQIQEMEIVFNENALSLIRLIRQSEILNTKNTKIK